MSEVENKLLPCPCLYWARTNDEMNLGDKHHPKCDGTGKWKVWDEQAARAHQAPGPDLTCIDGMIGGLPCPHCEKAVERYIAQNVRTVTTTGADPDLIERARKWLQSSAQSDVYLDSDTDRWLVREHHLAKFARSVAANDEMRWVPVESEKDLPKEDGVEYDITAPGLDGVPTVFTDTVGTRRSDGRRGWVHYTGVTAWRPRPKPFEALEPQGTNDDSS